MLYSIFRIRCRPKQQRLNGVFLKKTSSARISKDHSKSENAVIESFRGDSNPSHLRRFRIGSSSENTVTAKCTCEGGSREPSPTCLQHTLPGIRQGKRILSHQID